MNDALEILNRERARYTRIKADKEELKLRQMRKEVVPVEAVSKQWADMSANVRKKLLALEARLPGKLPGKNTREMAAVIREELYAVLNELAEEYPGYGNDTEE